VNREISSPLGSQEGVPEYDKRSKMFMVPYVIRGYRRQMRAKARCAMVLELSGICPHDNKLQAIVFEEC